MADIPQQRSDDTPTGTRGVEPAKTPLPPTPGQPGEPPPTVADVPNAIRPTLALTFLASFALVFLLLWA